MSVLDRIVTAADGLFRAGGNPQPIRQVGNPDIATQRDTYALLRSLYYANSLYSDLAARWAADGEKRASIKELRTIQAALVEVYVALVMPGNLPDALPIEFDTDNPRADKIRGAIHQVWTWSNWAQRKQLYVRHQAMLGDGFLYVASRPGPDGERADRVYYHIPEPEQVTDIDTDERGFITYIRTDVLTRDRAGATATQAAEPYVVTTEWWKAKDLYREWRTDARSYDPARLGTPEVDESMQGEFGIDFVPYVHAKHRDMGGTFGVAPIMTAIEKQHELNRKATAFSQQLYRHGKPDKVLQGAGGQTAGVYQPPPTIHNSTAESVEIDGETLWTMPPGYTIANMIANINYTAHMAGIDQDMDHLATSDLPELNWYRLSQSGSDASGAALQTLLKPTVAKIEEARGNAETALARADAMALTIGQVAKLPGFSTEEIGTYEAGDFEHRYAARDVVPSSAAEQSQIDLGRVQRVQAWTASGMPLDAAMRIEKFTQAEIDKALTVTDGIAR